jgi:hypothetical protein
MNRRPFRGMAPGSERAAVKGQRARPRAVICRPLILNLHTASSAARGEVVDAFAGRKELPVTGDGSRLKIFSP